MLTFIFLLGLFAAEVKLWSMYEHGQHGVLPLMVGICAVIAVVCIRGVATDHGTKKK